MRRMLLITSLALFMSAAFQARDIRLPPKPDSLRFAVIGDTGTGDQFQYDVGEQLLKWRQKVPYEFVLMMGDNIYGGEKTKDFERKFEHPYRALLEAGVKFYAALGNHDKPTESHYEDFNMNGKRYYSFSPRPGIRFFALDSNYLDKEQLDWLEKELAASKSGDWKICFFHHPLYSSGTRHGPNLALRRMLEPLFIKHQVSAVFQGHEHFYERIKPQGGVYYFISGAGGKLQKGGIRPSNITAASFDQDRHFMLVEIAKDEMQFQAISSTGKTVDSGTIMRPGSKPRTTQ